MRCRVSGLISVPGEDEVADMYELTPSDLTQAGYSSTKSRTGARASRAGTISSTGMRPYWASVRARTATSAAGATGPSQPQEIRHGAAGGRQRAGGRGVDRARPGDGRVHDAGPAHHGGHRAFRVRGALRAAVRGGLRAGGGSVARRGLLEVEPTQDVVPSFDSGTIAWERGLCALPAGLGAPRGPARCYWRWRWRCPPWAGRPRSRRGPPAIVVDRAGATTAFPASVTFTLEAHSGGSPITGAVARTASPARRPRAMWWRR